MRLCCSRCFLRSWYDLQKYDWLLQVFVPTRIQTSWKEHDLCRQKRMRRKQSLYERSLRELGRHIQMYLYDGYIYDEENKLCLDTRQGLCYAAVHQRHCEVTSTTGLMFTKAECCCNRGKGWGEQCEECPHPGTADFMEL